METVDKSKNSAQSKGQVDELVSAKVTVCDKCFQASCWQGIFLCDDALTAGTTEKTIEELFNLGLENPCYWEEH